MSRKNILLFAVPVVVLLLLPLLCFRCRVLFAGPFRFHPVSADCGDLLGHDSSHHFRQAVFRAD